MLVLKYLTWALTVGVAFAGSWLFDFTKADKDTGKKSLTPFGRWGIVVAALSLACALALTVWTDLSNARKEAESAARSVEERKQTDLERSAAAAYRQRSEKAQEETKSFLRIIGANYDKFSSDDKKSIAATVSSLSTAEDYKRQYPDLYEKLMHAGSGDQIGPIVTEGMDRNIKRRISTAAECANIPIRSWETGRMATPVKTGDFEIGPAAGLVFFVFADRVEFEISDASKRDLGPVKESYKFTFVDGLSSAPLRCKALKTTLTCRDATSDVGAKSVYEVLQRKTIAKIEGDQRQYNINAATADIIRRTFSCISP